MLPELAIELPAFLLGLLFGSFLNVCISRLPFHESVSKPRSHCPRCLHTIRWYDNIPLASWIILRARCRDCKATIPWRYPLVEFSMGAWFAFVGWKTMDLVRMGAAFPMSRLSGGLTSSEWTTSSLEIFAFAILGFLLIGLLVMDWQSHTLPDAFTLTGIATGFFLVCIQAIFLAPDEAAIHLDPSHSLRMSSPGSFVERGNVFLTGPEHLIFGRVAAIIGAALIPLAIRWLYKLVRGQQGMGLGDVKLMAMIAAFLGFWPAVLSFFLGCLFIFPYALTLLARKRATAATQLPFGSFLAAGGLVTALFGPPLIEWYKSFL
jgi:leader peptidase (prepilin peptidase)/N-methyltransferase